MSDIQILNSTAIQTPIKDAVSNTVGNSSSLLITANNDIEAIEKYLTTKCKKETTLNTVMGVLRKLQFFMNYTGIKKLSDFKVEQCEEFQKWLSHPPVEHVLQIDQSKASRDAKTAKIEKHVLDNGQLNPKWRPFACELKPQTVAWNIKPINALWSWLVNVNYLSANPWCVIDTANYDLEAKKQVRDLPTKLIQLTNQYLDEVQFESIKQQKTLIQKRWLFKLFLLTGSRLSACANAKTSDIKQNYRGDWELTLIVKGKGIRTHCIAWTDSLKLELERYREALGLKMLDDSKTGPNHLILSLRDPNKDMKVSRTLIWRNIKDLFSDVADYYEQLQMIKSYEADNLRDASPHWIRHSVASILGSHAKEQLGHLSDKQTSEYQHQQYLEQVQALEQLDNPTLSESFSFKLDDEVLAYFQATGLGWEDRINQILKNYINI
ncbi:MAG: BrnA antitoxin family protein [Saccharospirillaceae bacterium]|nr:BrnA antitoxin family protein [Pseudomonadales bacterium]NRB81731.1 BrnA antitoxin family protein [Saccharospirillaceae bacterium]